MSVGSNSARIRSGAVRTAIAAAVVGTTAMAGVLGAAGPAHASGSTDYVLIDTQRIDVGLVMNPFTFEYLAPGAPVRWQSNSTNQTYQPRLSGQMSLKNAADFCGKVRVEVFSFGDPSPLDDEESTPVCRGSNSQTFHVVEETLRVQDQSDVHMVRVSALLQFYPGGPYVVQDSKEVFPYE